MITKLFHFLFEEFRKSFSGEIHQSCFLNWIKNFLYASRNDKTRNSDLHQRLDRKYQWLLRSPLATSNFRSRLASAKESSALYRLWERISQKAARPRRGLLLLRVTFGSHPVERGLCNLFRQISLHNPYINNFNTKSFGLFIDDSLNTFHQRESRFSDKISCNVAFYP